MDYKKVLRLRFVNRLSCREIAESCGDCGKTSVNEFLKRFDACPELTYPLSEDVTNEYIEGLLYKKSGVPADKLLYPCGYGGYDLLLPGRLKSRLDGKGCC